jgi:flagellar protein FliO/FliZ
MGSDYFWAAVRLLVCLPLVVGLIYLVLRYGLPRQFLGIRPGRHIRVIEQVPLGAKTAVSLLRVGSKFYLVGHGEKAVAILGELEGDFPEEPSPAPAGLEKAFAARIRELVRRR